MMHDKYCMQHVWIFSTISNPAQDSQDSDDKCDGYRGCGCAKNKCLNLNCQCFRGEKYCHSHCKCVNCQNREEFKDQRQKLLQEAIARAKIAKEKSLLPKKEKQLPAQKCNCDREVFIKKSSQRDENN